MPKFFVCSDIHAFYDEWIDALEKAGFDWEDETHWLIVCGDYFDRGPKPIEVMEKLMSYPRAILVKGNHELLFEDAVKRGGFAWNDIPNGTAETIRLISGADSISDVNYFDLNRALGRVGAFFDKMMYYFETENFIFCHGWVPLEAQYDERGNWRCGTDGEWKDAMWENGMKCAMYNDTVEKPVVCGHYHTSWGHHKLNPRISEFDDDADFSPFYYKGCIAIDGCTAYSKIVNVLVLEDNFMDGKEFKNGEEATADGFAMRRMWCWKNFVC